MYTQWVFSVVRVPTWFFPGIGVIDCGPLSKASAIFISSDVLARIHHQGAFDIPLEKEEPSLEIPATLPSHLQAITQ